MISAVNHRPLLSGNKTIGNNKSANAGYKKTMMNRKLQFIKFLSLIVICCLLSNNSFAQKDSPKNRIAIFTPLYLDSVFNEDNEYRFSKNTFPKFINPGLEFYEGAQLALDSLKKEYADLEVFIYDTKSTTETISQQLKQIVTDSVHLIIAHCNSAELKLLAETGLRNHIPVINANLPNDGGISGNPYFVLLNPTLRTQCEGIYKHIQKYYSLNPIVVFRKKGQLEDRIKTYFEDFSKSTMGSSIKIKYVELSDSFIISNLRPYLDTTQQTLCIAGSLDENFGKKLVQQLAFLNKQNYQSAIMGMPTWDGIGFNKPEFKGIDIIYSTPFYNSKTDRTSHSIVNYFNKKMYARPSDMVFRGYEVTFRFARLLNQYGKDLASNLGNKQIKVFTDFDIQPNINKQNTTLDYFENKKLYFLKWEDGILKSVL